MGVTPAPGADVRVALSKWGNRPHWEFGAVLLGSDEHGDWLGIPAGTPMARPGVSIVAEVAQVGLVPGPGDDLARGWLATFHDEHGPVRVYVDMTTPAVWDGATLLAVDLDLDVVQRIDGSVFVDDEDEFAAHQVDLGYPRDVIALAEHSRDLVCAAITAGRPPYDGTAQAWLDLVRPGRGGSP